jgi:hypothetical protein
MAATQKVIRALKPYICRPSMSRLPVPSATAREDQKRDMERTAALLNGTLVAIKVANLTKGLPR